VEEWLGSVGAMVRAANGWLVGFWGLWCRIVAVGCIGYVVVMVVGNGDVIIWLQRWWGNVIVWQRWWWWAGIEVLLPLIRQRVLPLLLLAEDVNGVLQFC
jgi:hypothetical protein